MDPLYGIKILDLTQDFAGSFTAMRLGELGAEVIKLEPMGGSVFRKENPAVFAAVNRSSKSVWLELAEEKQKSLFLEMVKDADVVLESFQPGTMEALGCGFEELTKVNPKIVMTSVTAYGQTGPMKNSVAVDDAAVQAISGVMTVTGDAKTSPLKMGYAVSELLASAYACAGTSLALMQVLTTGKGSHVDVAKLDSLARGMEQTFTKYFMEKKMPVPVGNEHPTCVPCGGYVSKDGCELLINISRDDQFAKLCDDVLGHPEILETELRARNCRTNNRVAVNNSLNEWFAEKDAEELRQKMEEQKLAYGEINTISQVVEHPQIQARNMIGKVSLPDGGDVLTAARPYKIVGEKHQTEFKLAALGEDTLEILSAYAEPETLKEIYAGYL